MSSVDNRVVAMKFDNKQFQAGVKDTMGSLADLNQSLKMEGASKGLSSVSDAVGKFSLGRIGEAVDSIAGRFSAMSVIAITALSNITTKAMAAGAQLVKSLTIAPISEGFADYNLKLTSVKTIMNATGESLEVVNGYFKELDTYADKTVYNLSDMTGAFAKFTNAGVGMDKSVPAIKGIANMVALAGQGANEASIAMYNLSQSIAGGFLTTTDYKSLNLANVATKDWKNNMIEAAVAAGQLQKTGDDAYSIVSGKAGNAYTSAALFNEALAEGWATSDILLGVLGNYGDATTELGAKAQAAAQDVKSLPMMMETLKASVGTGWTETFEILLGNVEESTKLFTGLTGVIQGVLDGMSNARNGILEDWKALGGRTNLIEGIKNIWEAFLKVIEPIKKAFRDIFPPKTGADLFELTNVFQRFTEKLMITDKQFNQIKRIATGVFSAFQLIGTIIGHTIRVFGQLFGAMKEGESLNILEFFAKIGDWLTKLNKAAEADNNLRRWFNETAAAIKRPIEFIKAFAETVKGLFQEFKGGAAESAGGVFDRIKARVVPLSDFFKSLSGFVGTVIDKIGQLWKFLEPVRTALSSFFRSIGDGIKNAITNITFDQGLDAINTGLLAGLVLVVKKFLGGGLDFFKSGTGFVDKIKGMFDGVTDTLSAMQAKLKSEVLMKIAGAIGILALSVLALSLIDSGALTKSLTAITVMFVQLGAALAIFDKIGSPKAAANMGLLAVAFGLLGGAILILVASVAILAQLDWEGLAKGLGGVVVLIGALTGAAVLLNGNTQGAVAGAAAMVVMAGAIAILAGVVKIFSSMEWEELGKGIGGVVVLLGVLVGATHLLSTNAAGLIAGATSMLIMAGAVAVLAGVVKLFSGMNWDELAKGMGAMAVALGILAIAMKVMSAGLPGAGALIVAAAAVLIMAKALDQMGQMSWEQIAKAVVLLASSLAILAGAMYLMSAGLPGAAAVLVMAAALAVLAPVLIMLGEMSWQAIGMGLAALAGVLLTLGVSAMLLIPALVPLLLLGTAITLLGAGLALAGVGILSFATGLALLAGIGAGAAVVLGLLFNKILELIPKAIAALATGIVDFARIISESGPTFVAAVVTLITSIATAIDTSAPVVVNTLVKLVHLLLDTLVKNVPLFVEKGYAIITGFLNGIAKNLPGVITAGTNIIIAVIQGIGANALRIANAAASTIVTFVNGLATAVRTHSGAINEAGQNLASAIISGMTSGLTSGISKVASKAKEVAQGALNAAKKLLGIASPSKEFFKVGVWSDKGLEGGFDKGAGGVEAAAENTAQRALDVMKKTLGNLGDVLTKNELDLSPTIRPVLDLTDIQKGSKTIDGLLTPTAIVPLESYAQASAIAVEQRAAREAAADISTDSATTGPLVEVTQINNSPKALSASDIYRQTKNLVSTVKEVLP